MSKMDDNKCKDIIKFLARKLGADPKLIVTRLMSEDDKNDMRNGNLPIKSLECHIKVWMENGCPDYVNINTEPLTQVEGKDNTRQQENLKESRRDVKKERIVTPAPLIPPKAHGQWEYRSPFIRPEDNRSIVSEEEEHLDL